MKHEKPVVILATAPGCPYCPTMKQQLQQLQARGLMSDLQTVDISQATDFAAQHQIRSVPWLQIGKLVFTGMHTLAELEYWMTHATSNEGIREYIGKELEGGRLDAVDQLLQEHPQWLAIAVTLIADMEAPMQARIGLSALIESANDQALLQTIQPMLIAYTQHEDARVRGDACHLLAFIQGEESIQALRTCLQDSDALVREIAEDSLALLA